MSVQLLLPKEERTIATFLRKQNNTQNIFYYCVLEDLYCDRPFVTESATARATLRAFLLCKHSAVQSNLVQSNISQKIFIVNPNTYHLQKCVLLIKGSDLKLHYLVYEID